jgi:hypothetical protein
MQVGFYLVKQEAHDDVLRMIVNEVYHRERGGKLGNRGAKGQHEDDS